MNPIALEIRRMPVADLSPAPYNPRRNLQSTDPAYRKLAASLSEFGLVEPLVWNEVTGYVVGGHARLRILKEMGVTEVPVSVVRLSAEREKALNVVLNNREAQGRFDSNKLAQILDDLAELPEFEFTGFDKSDLAALRFEPADEHQVAEEAGMVEVTLTSPAAVYDRLAPRLDALVAEFDLVCHVRRR
ncbi:MAG: ParB N-terminal domain-containing protein [Gemmataceae bacterium]